MKSQSTETRGVDSVIEGRPWWKNCLMIAGISLVVILLATIVTVRFFSGSGPRRVRKIPENFPVSFSIFRPEEVSSIYLYTSEEKQRPLKLATLPLRFLGRVSDQTGVVADQIERGASVMQGADTLSLEWWDVEASVQEVLLFYAGSMMQSGIADPKIRTTESGDVSEMIGSSDLIGARLYVIDDPATEKIDQITLSVDYPPAVKK